MTSGTLAWKGAWPDLSRGHPRVFSQKIGVPVKFCGLDFISYDTNESMGLTWWSDPMGYESIVVLIFFYFLATVIKIFIILFIV